MSLDQLYEEGAHWQRMMVVSLRDRISRHANRVHVLDRFLSYARSKTRRVLRSTAPTDVEEMGG
jgi:hypothetical protein